MPSPVCRICLDSLDSRSIITATQCGHAFCYDCAIFHFTRQAAKCPMCRKRQTFEQMIRLFLEWDTDADTAATPDSPPSTSPVRLPLCSNPKLAWPTEFPSDRAGPAVGYVETEYGQTPMYLGSAIIRGGLHPCRIVGSSQPRAYVSYGGVEYPSPDIYYLLPFDPDTMEWVPAVGGVTPEGRRPVEGGHERTGERLYHALATIDGVKVPGKAGVHLYCGDFPFAGVEHQILQYEILRIHESDPNEGYAVD